MRNTGFVGIILAAGLGMIDYPNSAAARASKAASESAIAVQPVEEYFLPFVSDGKGNRPGMLPRERMTHLGTDFGMMGPAGDRIRWKDGQAIADARSGGWAGIWHSLAGLGRDTQTTLDFGRVYPTWIVDSKQPRCTGIVVRLSGQGQF